MGNMPYRYILFAEHFPGGLRFVSLLRNKPVVTEVTGRDDMQVGIRVTYDPASHRLAVAVNGRDIAVYGMPGLIPAPAEITLGENRVEPGLTNELFTGQIRDVVRSVQPGRH